MLGLVKSDDSEVTCLLPSLKQLSKSTKHLRHALVNDPSVLPSQAAKRADSTAIHSSDKNSAGNSSGRKSSGPRNSQQPSNCCSLERPVQRLPLPGRQL